MHLGVLKFLVYLMGPGFRLGRFRVCVCVCVCVCVTVCVCVLMANVGDCPVLKFRKLTCCWDEDTFKLGVDVKFNGLKFLTVGLFKVAVMIPL